MDISGCHGKAGDHPGPAQVNMDPEAIEGLPGQDILPESPLSSEALAAVCPGELTDRKGEAIHQSKGRVILNGAQDMLPYLLLDLPEVGRLAQESGPMHSRHCRKEVPIMLAEIPVQGGVLAEAQEFSHHFQRQYLKLGAGPRWRKGFPGEMVFNVSSMRQKTAMINASRSTTHLHGKSLSLIKRCHGLDFRLDFHLDFRLDFQLKLEPMKFEPIF